MLTFLGATVFWSPHLGWGAGVQVCKGPGWEQPLPAAQQALNQPAPLVKAGMQHRAEGLTRMAPTARAGGAWEPGWGLPGKQLSVGREVCGQHTGPVQTAAF